LYLHLELLEEGWQSIIEVLNLDWISLDLVQQVIAKEVIG
jgi:hypothetical protein